MTKAIGALMMAAGPTMLLLAALDIITMWEAIGIATVFIVLGMVIMVEQS